MKKKNRLLSLLLALLIAGTALVSCVTNQPGEDDATTPDNTSGQLPAVDLNLIVNGESNFEIIRPQDLKSDDPYVVGAADIRNAISGATNVAPKIKDDFTKDGTHDADAIEILVGVTNYEESTKALSELTYGQYVVRVMGHKLVVAAYSEDAMRAAASRLISQINDLVTEDGLIIPADLYITDTVDGDLAALPTYEGGTFSSTYKSGGEAMQVIIKNTNAEQYRNYLKKLGENGFTEYTTNEIKDNCFATYNNDAYTINAGFYKYENSARIIIEDLAKPAGLEADNVYTPVTTSQITMLGLSYTASDGSTPGNGLSVLIRLTDGRFIIIDGGFSRSECAAGLVNELKAQSKDYLSKPEYVGKGTIVIAAWVITHSHGDHNGMVNKYYGSFTGFKVEKFLVNFMSDSERLRSVENYSKDASPNITRTEGTGYKTTLNAASVLKADVHHIRVGQVFYFADLTLEVLYTIDSFGPRLCNAINTTSTVLKMTFGDGTVYMCTGDATGNGMEICAKMYGDYLKSDIVQIAHHGYSTWGNNSGTILAYNFMLPTTLLWPMSMKGYDGGYKTKAYNVVLFSPNEAAGGQNPNFKEVFVAGNQGDIITVPIPYAVGATVVKRA